MLEVKNVSKQYKGEDKLLFDAVSDVSLSMVLSRILSTFESCYIQLN